MNPGAGAAAAAGYESDRLLSEYLLFHYGTAEEILPYDFGPREALAYPVRCVSECLGLVPPGARALDLGCAVGRSSFELARHCASVLGIDLSRRFIAAAEALQRTGELPYERADEGDLCTPLIAGVPKDLAREKVRFEVGDATALRSGLGSFDVVLMANLIDRLGDPARCLARLPELVAPAGQLIISSPYTWLTEFTPRERWLGGFHDGARRVTTRETLQALLAPAFELTATKNLPFLIREHVRKFQWSVAQATVWRRR